MERMMLRKVEGRWFILGEDVMPRVKWVPRPSKGTVAIQWAMMATGWARGHVDFTVDGYGYLHVESASWARPSDVILEELRRWGRPTPKALEKLEMEDPRLAQPKWWEELIYTSRIIDGSGLGYSYSPGREGGTYLILPTLEYPVRMFNEYHISQVEELNKSADECGVYLWWVGDDDGC